MTAKRAYFALSAMVATDSRGNRQMIVTAPQGDRNCHMWIVTDWICQNWSKWNYWIRSKSIVTSKCIWILLNVFLNFGSPISSMYKLHIMNNRRWTFMNYMTILTYHWIGPCISRYSLSPQPSTNSIDFMVTGFPIEANCMLNHGNVFIYFLSIVLEVTMEFCS